MLLAANIYLSLKSNSATKNSVEDDRKEYEKSFDYIQVRQPSKDCHMFIEVILAAKSERVCE